MNEEEGEDELDDPDVDEAEMAKQLAELEKKDPEFFKYLKDNDAELLDFGQDEEPAKKSKKQTKAAAQEEDEDEEMEFDGAESDSDEEEPDFEGIPEAAEPEKISVTMKMLRGWQRAMIEQKSLRSLRKMVLAFRAAAHMNEAGEEDFETRYKVDSAMGGLFQDRFLHPYLPISIPVFNKLILTALKFTPVVLAKHIPYKELPNGRLYVNSRNA